MFDLHTHYLTRDHWGHEYDAHWAPAYGGGPWVDVTPSSFDAAMAEGGVETAVVFGLRASRSGVRTPNSELAAFIASLATPAMGFMALDLSDEDLMDQVDEGISLGFRGVKLYPVLAHTDPRDRRFDAFYAKADAHGLVILWHMGATPSPSGSLTVSQPMVLDEVAARWPNLTMIVAHLGHPWQRDTLILCRKHRRVFADVSGVSSRPMDAYLSLVQAQEWGVTDKLIFGSDFPLWTPKQAVEDLRQVSWMRAGNFPYVREETIEEILVRDSLTMLRLH